MDQDVTNQQKIEYLKKYKDLDKYIDQLLEDAEVLRTEAERVTPALTGIPPGSDGENKRELAICKLVDLNNEIDKKIEQYVNLGREIRSLIDGVENNRHRRLLQYRYIEGKTWEKIAEIMDCDYRYIFKLHISAITDVKTKRGQCMTG